jgi:hypothetical protein
MKKLDRLGAGGVSITNALFGLTGESMRKTHSGLT